MSTDQPSVAKRSPGRPGLTRQDVVAAFKALSQHGITDPSLLQLREHLGRGSNTTIARLRQEIRGEQLLASRTPVAGSLEAAVLPALAGVMEKLGEEAAEAADAHIEAMRAEFESTTRKMVQARDQAEQTLRDMRLEYHAREGQIRDAKETSRSLQLMLSEERDRWEQTRAALEAQRTAALEAEKQAREGAAETEAQRAALEARLSDAQRIIDSLIDRVGEPPKSS
jgi:hypothetical protein